MFNGVKDKKDKNIKRTVNISNFLTDYLFFFLCQVLHSSILSFKKDLMNVMLTLEECLARVRSWGFRNEDKCRAQNLKKSH